MATVRSRRVVDLPHPAGANCGADLVGAQARPGGKLHVREIIGSSLVPRSAMVSFAVLSPDLRFDPRNLVGSVERLGGNIDRVSGNFAPDGALYVAEAAGNGTASADCGVMGDGQVCAGDGSRYARAKVNQNASVC